jgi:hypothetical protein
MVMVQPLNAQDTVNRKTVCEDLLKAPGNDINHFLMTDETNFHLCGYVNSQNCHYWATENPCDIDQGSLHPAKVIVRCGVSSFGLIGPYFFQDEVGRQGSNRKLSRLH